PTVSSATPSAIFKDAVDTNERTAKTKVMVKSGETLVIGGLLRQDTTEKKTKVPVLGDLFPFLFSRTDKQKGKTDLVMFLIPRVITGDEAKTIAEQEKKRLEEKEAKE
ncbi:MAG: type II and III secretion system protein, partial [Candidatus Omnitrophica bacterium]|nr:type II and III secretion system protein [Candidatus Omnitrophota bacterium]